MPYPPQEIVERYATGAPAHANGRSLAPDAAAAWQAVRDDRALTGSARVRDSARREWRVEARRDATRGRFLVLSPVHADQEPFRASPDGYRPDAYLRITEPEWNLLALVSVGRPGDEGRQDEELRAAAFGLVDAMVRAAQHQQLMGAAEDDDE